MDKHREAFEGNRFWIGIFRTDVDFKGELGEFGLYEAVKSGVSAPYLSEFNNKWVIWCKAWQSRQAEVDQLEEWNTNQAQSIKTYQEEDEAMKELLQKLIDDEYTTMRPSMAYEIQKVLRGEHE